GAKGLTKRVCFVPDISFGDVSEPGFAMVSPEDSLEINLSDLSGGKIKSPDWKAAREADKAVRNAESLNVFYVAMTRARDLVVLSGAGTKRTEGWLKMADSFIAKASPDVLRRLKFDEVLQAEGQTSEVGVQRTEDRTQRDEISFQPLKIPKGMERKPVTSLVDHSPSDTRHSTPAADRRSFGTLGHAVLEELAKNRWQGDIPDLLRQFSPTEYEGLAQQLEAARVLLEKETAAAEVLFAEHPFVLKRGNLILDGTIDLLVKFPHDPVAPEPPGEGGWKIYDYKFSNESADVALETYRPQLEAYQEAVEKLHPGEEVTAALVLIGAEAVGVTSPV
ncbi:MAG TPA: PD-(D/E)XK nuclease family protein, partial [Tichowtungia sp.]|nr:PD-(D/E)XK nuclease family protein [Tichowtungia sp.]